MLALIFAYCSAGSGPHFIIITIILYDKRKTKNTPHSSEDIFFLSPFDSTTSIAVIHASPVEATHMAGPQQSPPLSHKKKKTLLYITFIYYHFVAY